MRHQKPLVTEVLPAAADAMVEPPSPTASVGTEAGAAVEPDAAFIGVKTSDTVQEDVDLEDPIGINQDPKIARSSPVEDTTTKRPQRLTTQEKHRMFSRRRSKTPVSQQSVQSPPPARTLDDLLHSLPLESDL